MDIVSAKRDHLIETARGLFYKNGFHATGIDTILAESGVAKMTLYKYFKSKDDLILAVMEHQHARISAQFQGEIERRSRSPARRLLLVFDVLADYFRSENFRGCPFLNAASEYSGLDPRIQNVVAQHKRWVRELLEQYASKAGATDANRLAKQLDLLVEGAVAMALIEPKADSARTAKEAARVLIRAAIPERPGRSTGTARS